jgi:sigma-B regulation protein RsbU (phosphoserine phosphatase)
LHLRQDDNGVGELVRTGIPLGIFEDKEWRQETVQLDPGDVLVLYTDGITEAHRKLPFLFGEERLRKSVRATLDAAGSQRPSAREIQDQILADVDGFVGGAPRSDDIALTTAVRR